MSIGDYLSIRMIVLSWFNYTGYLGGSHFFCANPFELKEIYRKKGVSFDTTFDLDGVEKWIILQNTLDTFNKIDNTIRDFFDGEEGN